MLPSTFCHIRGIGNRMEQRLWEQGFLTWDDVLAASSERGELKQAVRKSHMALANRDASFFGSRLQPADQWRLFPHFQSDVAYLDIETTGLRPPHNRITTIALYNGSSISTYVAGRNLAAFPEDIGRYRVLVTYNGKCFDVPFLEAAFGIRIPQPHIDLRYVLKGLGYTGGLKRCEHLLGLSRDDLDGVDGYTAVLLWQEFQRTRREETLNTLLSYNVCDVINLEQLMVTAYNQLLARTPFRQLYALPHPPIPGNPFTPDILLLKRLQYSLF